MAYDVSPIGHRDGSESQIAMTIADFQIFLHTMVVLHLHNGETLTARIMFVNAEYESFVMDVIDTDRPEQYEAAAGSAFALPASHVISIQALPGAETDCQ